ncbi:peroxiredoxin [archaeon CG10_big_fil_rev_8_21_14_0_10_43_11]|nr:MAG: peroxiredoxin [archaeon CG10_big_fil_rev_8_21_14_0_10_43_11]
MAFIGEKAPNFQTKAYHNDQIKTIKLSDYHGKWIILFFYPADFTFVCPTELGELADYYNELKKLKVEVLSVSTDTEYVHKAWHDASDTIKKIKFPMLADPTGNICKSYGTYIDGEGLSWRATFLIDPEGEIVAVEMNSNSIGRNVTELIRKLQAAQYVYTHGGEACPASWTPNSKTLKPGLNLVGKI